MAKQEMALCMTSKLSELRREIAETADVAGKLDVRATAIIRDKRDMWRAIEVRRAMPQTFQSLRMPNIPVAIGRENKESITR